VSPPVRSLSPEEAELWARVAATIRPLSREQMAAPADKRQEIKVAPKPGTVRSRSLPPAHPRTVPIARRLLAASASCC
jgi:hypothetical protein